MESDVAKCLKDMSHILTSLYCGNAIFVKVDDIVRVIIFLSKQILSK